MGNLHIIFDGPPGPTAPRFIECETPDGYSVNVGTWRQRSDGLWALVIPSATALQVELAEARALLRDCLHWLPRLEGHEPGSQTDLLCDRIRAALEPSR